MLVALGQAPTVGVDLSRGCLPQSSSLWIIYNIAINDFIYIRTNTTIPKREAIVASESIGYKRVGAMALRARRGLKTAALAVLAVGVLVAATTAFAGGTAHAATQMTAGLDVLETFDVARDREGASRHAWDLGVDAMTATWPAIPAYSSVSALESGWGEASRPNREVYVWATFMTVGVATDGNMTYTGYMPGAVSGAEGSLAHRSFTHGDTDYNVLALFHQQVNGGVQQLTLIADRQLPEYLVFYAGNDEFKVSESVTMGAGQNIHVWRVDSGPGWTEGQRVIVALLEEFGGESPALTISE